MFTGIVAGLGTVVDIQDKSGIKTIRINIHNHISPPDHGKSVAVDGVCLSAVERNGTIVTFNVMEETLTRTTLNNLSAGDRVNIEQPLQVSDDLSGHIVQGHVDGIGKIVRREDYEDNTKIWFKINDTLMRYMVPKGSITVDGVSMTIAEINDDEICIAVIPETKRITTLGFKQAGDLFNVEADFLAKLAYLTFQNTLTNLENRVKALEEKIGEKK